MSERRMITGPAGRQLEVEIAGAADGRLLVYHYGTPCAGRLFTGHIEACVARELRLVTYSRPGYASSTRQAGRSVADCAEDVRAIADALGAEQLYVAGESGGGPHTLACAALLPERVLAAATIASVAPFDVEGLDWLDGMGEENIQEFAAARAGEEPLRAFLERMSAEITSGSAAELEAALGDLLSGVDRATISGEFAEHLVEATSAALECGIWGWFDDDMAFLRDWGFELQSLKTPVTIWQGKQDRFVPWQHGEWLGAHVGSARLQLRPEHGHLSLELDGFGEVLDDLLATVDV